ncbi:hypothetical protein [Nocardia abscessus]|uniref:hypothetical protein n=1 Tax=Nocardia abscessus TaxID=120957 RepID=UPI00313E8CDD
MFDDDVHVVVEAGVGAVHDLIHGERRDDGAGVRGRVCRILTTMRSRRIVQQRFGGC